MANQDSTHTQLHNKRHQIGNKDKVFGEYMGSCIWPHDEDKVEPAVHKPQHFIDQYLRGKQKRRWEISRRSSLDGKSEKSRYKD